jgi:hypothetical protein
MYSGPVEDMLLEFLGKSFSWFQRLTRIVTTHCFAVLEKRPAVPALFLPPFDPLEDQFGLASTTLQVDDDMFFALFQQLNKREFVAALANGASRY